jgi:hypothetical protein
MKSIYVKVCPIDSKRLDMPPYLSGRTFKQAEKVKKSTGKQGELEL